MAQLERISRTGIQIHRETGAKIIGGSPNDMPIRWRIQAVAAATKEGSLAGS